MKNYRPDIDGLRAIAVLVVVLFHGKFDYFSGGFIGVDVFFVISGYLITNHLFEEVKSTGSISFSNFYAKRFKRLYPALLTTVALTVAAYVVLFPHLLYISNLFLKSAEYSVVGIANIFFFRKVSNYFDPTTDDMPFLHFWSLGVEEQFYLIWPVIILAVFFLNKKLKKSLRSTLSSTLLILSACSFFLSEYWILKNGQPQAFYLMPSRIWELGIGGLIALNQQTIAGVVSKLSKNICDFLGVLALGLICATTVMLDEFTLFPGHNALYPVLATAIIISIGFAHKTNVSKLLSLRTFTTLGLLSYGWYLWHWPFFSFLNIYYMGEETPAYLRILAAVLSLGLAWLSLNYIEKPIRSGEFVKKFSSRKVTIVTAMISLALIAGTRLLSKNIGEIYSPIQGKEFVQIIQTKPRSKECLKDNSCSSINKNADKVIYLWGDSHAGTYSDMVEVFSRQNNLDASYLTEYSLPPLVTLPGVYRYNGAFMDYKGLADKAFGTISAEKRKKSVILAARWNAYTGLKPISVVDEPIFLTKNLDTEKTIELYKTLMDKTVHDLFASGVSRILIILQFPEYKYSVVKCSKLELGCPSSLNENLNYRQILFDYFHSLTTKYPNKLELFDPIKTFCTETECPQVVKQKGKYYPLTYDDDHPSVWSSLNMIEHISDQLRWLTE